MLVLILQVRSLCPLLTTKFPLYSKSGNFEAPNFQNNNSFCKKNNTTARATPGEQAVSIIFPKISVILKIKSFKVASCHVGTQKISLGCCDLDSWSITVVPQRLVL